MNPEISALTKQVLFAYIVLRSNLKMLKERSVQYLTIGWMNLNETVGEFYTSRK